MKNDIPITKRNWNKIRTKYINLKETTGSKEFIFKK